MDEELTSWIQWARSASPTAPAEKPPEKADIGLIQCPMWSESWPTLSLGFLASSAEATGIRTAVFDLNIALFNAAPENIREYWHWSKLKYWEEQECVDLLFQRFRREIDSHIATILGAGCRLLGFSIFDSTRLFSIRLAKEIKARSPHTFILFGGPGIDQPYWRKLVPRSCCDAFAIGEGEITLAEVYQNLAESNAIEPRIPGIIREEAEYTPRPQILNLDEFHHPTWESFDIRSYRAPSIPLLFSRGCVCRCSFCTDAAYYKQYRHRSPENMMNEIRYHVERYGIRDFRFQDMMFNGDLAAVDALCEAMISSGLELRWSAMIAARKEMTQERYDRLRRAGCNMVDMGVESGSNRVLKLIRKITTAEDISRNLWLANRAGIQVNIGLVLGHPGEEEQDVRATLDFVKENAGAIRQVNNVTHCLVMFRSDIRNRPEHYGIVLPDPPETAFFRWRSIDGKNTLETRANRVRRVLDLCASLGIPIGLNNLFDGAELDMEETCRVLRPGPEAQ